MGVLAIAPGFIKSTSLLLALEYVVLAMPFALFDLSDRVPLASGVALSIACFALVESGLGARFADPAAAGSAAGYYPYSAVVALAALIFSLYQTSAANAKAEQQLRHVRRIVALRCELLEAPHEVGLAVLEHAAADVRRREL